jgi:ATP/maltotriose-dependent transcriptional regulator MalT
MDTTASSPRPSADGLPRAALLDRVRAAGPAIVVLVAPAGFGKSTLARQLVAGLSAVALCDCRGVASELDLARRVVAALAAAAPRESAVLSRRETLLGDEQAGVGERLAVALAAWREEAAATAFVVENAEDALADRGARGFLAALLAVRPESRRIVLCSREPLRMHLSRFAPPHRILTLRAAEMAFGRDEIRALFAGTGASSTLVERVAELSGGWPIAVLLLVRFAHEGRLEALLDALDDVAYEDLHEYLADQVLAEAAPATLDGLLAAAAIPQALERDLRLALGSDAALATFERFAAGSPFLAQHDGVYTVHPLLAAALAERHPARIAGLLARTVAAYATAGEWQRVAEIDFAAGDQDAAAAALERIEARNEATPPIAVARLLASLDGEVVRRHPRLWSTTALVRTFTVDARSLLDEAADVGARVPDGPGGEQRAFVSVFRALVLAYAGEFEAALGVVEELRAAIAAPEVPQTPLHGWLLYLRALAGAPLGHTGAAERDLEAAWPFIESTPLAAAGALLTQGAELARVRGERDTERERIARALEIAYGAGLRNFIAFYEAEGAFGAWLAGDGAAFGRHAAVLETAVERDGVRGFAFFAAAARGRLAEPKRHDHPEWVARAYLVAAANSVAAGDAAAAQRDAANAVRLAQDRQGPFTGVLAALALAELDPARRGELYAHAATLAQRIDAEPLHAAVGALAHGGDAAFLAPFLGRYRTAGGTPARGGVIVELVSGRVLHDGEPVNLAEREHALLTAIAIRPEAVARGRLTDQLWPDLGESAARNAFHVCLHRLKARLGGGDAVVVRTPDGYRLGSGARVDLWEIERALGALRGDGSPGDEHAPQLRELYGRVRAARPARLEAWEWFDQTERRLRELRCEIAQTLAELALERGDTQEALALCHEMIAYDPCDEPAREIAIRAHLAGGDRAAALRHFRQYRDVLTAELQCEPSAALAQLVGAVS